MAKRKQRGASSSAMSGTFTRSRSEFFLHRTRSGRARLDPKRRQPAPAPHLSYGPHNSVKDLRLKRVFSDHEVKIDGDDHQADEKRGGSDDFEIAKGSSDDASREDSMQTTTKNLDKASESDGVRVSEETNSGNSPENKLRLWPCSRLKLIGNPSSFSYRRLLPYLKDMAKDGSSGIGILQSHNCGLPKVEKPMEESRCLLNSSSEQQNHDVPLGCLLNSSSEQQNHDVPLGDSTMVYSNGDHDFKENPVLEATHPDSHQEIVDTVMKAESPSTCIGSKLPIPGVTSEVGFNDKNMDELNRQEQKATNKERIGNDVEVLKESDDCSVDMVQSTPPDAELATKFDGAELGSRRTTSEPGFSSMSKNSSGLVLCSRSKLYRNPSSFSYRRLLPYLMDLAKNSSSGMDTIHFQNCTKKVETSLQEKPLMLDTTPSPTQQHQTVHPVDSSSVHSGENQDSEVNHGSESSGLDSQGDIHNSVTTELPNSCNMSKGQAVGCATEIPQEKSNFEFEMLSKSSFCTPIISEALSVGELAGVMPELSNSPMETERTPKQNVSQFKGFGHGAKQVLAPRKSILKKQSQSRGCKGICMCLDCTMFHVHAERAYEFSRRQMSDADEVVERLMKELSHLRNLMERSVVLRADGAESYAVIQVNQDQVKEDCQRAFRVEEQTKSRMRQMFCDLNTHCRIPGPRVSFSDHVDERNIS